MRRALSISAVIVAALAAFGAVPAQAQVGGAPCDPAAPADTQECRDYLCGELQMPEYCGDQPVVCQDPALVPPDCLPTDDPVACAGVCPGPDADEPAPEPEQPETTPEPVDSSTVVADRADPPDAAPAPATAAEVRPLQTTYVRELPFTGDSVGVPLALGLGSCLIGLGLYRVAGRSRTPAGRAPSAPRS